MTANASAQRCKEFRRRREFGIANDLFLSKLEDVGGAGGAYAPVGGMSRPERGTETPDVTIGGVARPTATIVIQRHEQRRGRGKDDSVP